MLKNHLYEVYKTCEERNCTDLTTALAMYLADARVSCTEGEARELREFMGLHGKELANAYPDRVAFDAAVDAAEAADAELAEV